MEFLSRGINDTPQNVMTQNTPQLLLDCDPPQPPRKRRKGSRIYTGCGICRTRKIKCDERRPSCLNCERSRRYVCDGYDISNNSESATTASNAVQDLATPNSAFEWSTWDASLDILDGRPNDNILTLMGDLEHTANNFSQYNSLDSELWDQTGANMIAARHFDSDGATRTSQLLNVSIPPILPPIETPNLSSATSNLLQHYRSHVCQLMMPTLAPSHNPWLRLYIPLALQEPTSPPRQALLFAMVAVAAFNRSHLLREGRKNLQEQAQEFYNRAIALLKSVLDTDGDEDITSEKYVRQALMAAVLTLSTVEVFSGFAEGCGYQHLQLGKQVIQKTGGLRWWTSDPSCLTLLQIFRCLRIVASTSGWADHLADLEPSTEGPVQGMSSEDLITETPVSTMADDTHPSDPAPPVADYTLDITFGVSIKTLRCLNEIVELSRIKRNMLPDESWPGDGASRLSQLEAEIFGTLDDLDAFSGESVLHFNRQEGIPTYVAEVIRENHLWAFHYSTAIFFRRALCGGFQSPQDAKSSSTARPSGQYLVSKALEHLESIDTLTRDQAVANTLWPGFIAAVEAMETDLRHRALVWFGRAKRYGIGNIAQAISLVMEVWRRVDRQIISPRSNKGVDSELGCVDWRDVMREKGMYIMLT